MNTNCKKIWSKPLFSHLNASAIKSGVYANGAENVKLAPDCVTIADSTSPQPNVFPSDCTSVNPSGMWNCNGIIVDTTYLTYDLIFVSAAAAVATIVSAQCS